MGGVVAPVLDLGSDLVSSAGDLGQGAIDTVKDVGKTVDQTVRDTLPGGWTTAALLGAGYYYSPEIGAYLSADGTSMATAADVAAADAAAAAPALTGYDAAMADLAASAPAITAAPAVAAVPELTGYDAAMADLATSTPAFTGAEAAGLGLGGSMAAGAAGAAALGSMLIPDVPGMASSYTPPKKYEADYSVKFDDPVKQLTLPDDFNFQLDSAPSPYLTKSETGQSAGGMLFNPNEQYASNLIRGLRAASNAPASANPGFTIYQSAKP